MLEAETLWLSQKQLTELFGKAKGTISEHIKHIFDDGELILLCQNASTLGFSSLPLWGRAGVGVR